MQDLRLLLETGQTKSFVIYFLLVACWFFRTSTRSGNVRIEKCINDWFWTSKLYFEILAVIDSNLSWDTPVDCQLFAALQFYRITDAKARKLLALTTMSNKCGPTAVMQWVVHTVHSDICCARHLLTDIEKSSAVTARAVPEAHGERIISNYASTGIDFLRRLQTRQKSSSGTGHRSTPQRAIISVLFMPCTERARAHTHTRV